VEDETRSPARPGLAARLCGCRPSTSLARAEASKASESEGKVEIQYATRSRPYVHAERVERGDIARPGGRRFGALVHAVLASIDLDASADAVHASATINGRIVSATEEEVQAAIVTVGTALGHPILRRAVASAEKGGLRRRDAGPAYIGRWQPCRRRGRPGLPRGYTRFCRLDGGGLQDRREFAVSFARYIAQVRVYSEAVGAATGSPARGIVLVL